MVDRATIAQHARKLSQIYLHRVFFSELISKFNVKQRSKMRSTILLLFLMPLVCHSELSDNLRATLDLSTRTQIADGGSETNWFHFVGIDTHKVFTDSEGDWSTLVAQAYWVRKDPENGPSGWDFTTRMLNLNVTGLKRLDENLPNLRIGHYEIPYGLEHLINTNGTLHDFIHGPNLGLKPDWGIFLNDTFDSWEYEFGLSRGTGMHYRRSGGHHAFAGRVGTPSHRDLVLGASFYSADLASGERTRFGVDAQRYLGAFGLLADLSVGEDGDDSVTNSLFEANWRNPTESWFLYLQGVRMDKDSATTTGSTGFRYAPDSHWSFDGQVKKVESSDGQLSLQLRYRF